MILAMPCHWQVGLGTLRRNEVVFAFAAAAAYPLFVCCLVLSSEEKANEALSRNIQARRHSHRCFRTVGALIQKPHRSGQGPSVSVGFHCVWSCSFGFRLCFLFSRPYLCFCGCVSVDRKLLTEGALIQKPLRPGQGP